MKQRLQKLGKRAAASKNSKNCSKRRIVASDAEGRLANEIEAHEKTRSSNLEADNYFKSVQDELEKHTTTLKSKIDVPRRQWSSEMKH